MVEARAGESAAQLVDQKEVSRVVRWAEQLVDKTVKLWAALMVEKTADLMDKT